MDVESFVLKLSDVKLVIDRDEKYMEKYCSVKVFVCYIGEINGEVISSFFK